MYIDNTVHVDTLQNNFKQYCLERHNWILLIGDRLEITNNKEIRITRCELATLYNDTYNAEVSDDTAKEEGKRILLIYKQFSKKGLDRGVFVKENIIQSATFGDVINTFAPNDQAQAYLND